MPGEDEISLEQLYKMLHISKRKASWMLNNGIIPCRIRPTKTHRYVILLEDVEIYLQKQRKARREEIPVGISGTKPRKREVLLNRQPVDTVTIAECYTTLADEYKDAFRAHVEKRLRYTADAFVIDTAAEIIGYSRGMVLSHIQQKHIDAVRISGKYIISKAAIVDFLVNDIAFGIVNKSAWHMNTILMFSNKE